MLFLKVYSCCWQVGGIGATLWDRLTMEPEASVCFRAEIGASASLVASQKTRALSRHATEHGSMTPQFGSIAPANALPLIAVALEPEATVTSVSEAVPSLDQYNSYT